MYRNRVSLYERISLTTVLFRAGKTATERRGRYISNVIRIFRRQLDSTTARTRLTRNLGIKVKVYKVCYLFICLLDMFIIYLPLVSCLSRCRTLGLLF